MGPKLQLSLEDAVEMQLQASCSLDPCWIAFSCQSLQESALRTANHPYVVS